MVTAVAVAVAVAVTVTVAKSSSQHGGISHLQGEKKTKRKRLESSPDVKVKEQRHGRARGCCGVKEDGRAGCGWL